MHCWKWKRIWDVQSLLKRAEDKKEEFIQKLILREILERQSQDFQGVVGRSSVFRLPVAMEGIRLVCRDIGEWERELELAVMLSLMEKDMGKKVYYWVTPLLREEILDSLGKEVRKGCHQAAVEYYRGLLSSSEDYEPVYASELIDHAVQCGMQDLVVEEGGELLSFLRNHLA